MMPHKRRDGTRPARAAFAILTLLLLLSTVALFGESKSAPPPQRSWDEAIIAYREGAYESALSRFRTMERSRKPGEITPALWYNLGTTQARVGENAEAAHYLRMTLAAEPHHREAFQNLQETGFALEPGYDPPLPLAGLRGWVRPAVQMLPPWLWSAMTAVVWVLAALGVWSARRRGDGRLTRPTLTLLIVAVALSLVASWNAFIEPRLTVGSVVIEDSARSGPGDSFAALYSFPAGSAVWLDAARSEAGFARVWLADGRAGYLPLSSVRPVVIGVEANPGQ